MTNNSPDTLFEIADVTARLVTNRADMPEFIPVGIDEYHKQVIAPEGIIYQGDSLAWLKSLDDGSVDLIFADPPYNIKRPTGIILNPRKRTLHGVWNGLRRLAGYYPPREAFTCVVSPKSWLT